MDLDGNEEDSDNDEMDAMDDDSDSSNDEIPEANNNKAESAESGKPMDSNLPASGGDRNESMDVDASAMIS
jgi:hypothetical protein